MSNPDRNEDKNGEGTTENGPEASPPAVHSSSSRAVRLGTLAVSCAIGLAAAFYGTNSPASGPPQTKVSPSAKPKATASKSAQPEKDTAPKPEPKPSESASPSPSKKPTRKPPKPPEPKPETRTPQPRQTPADSPGRHDGSNYDNLSPEGREAHDTLNCADIPGHKKGSCNEPNRKCNLAGATAVSSGGIHLTCRMASDGRLRWLA